MILRAPLHLLVLVGLLVTLVGQIARSPLDQQPALISAASQTQPSSARAIATSAAPSESGIATATLTNTVYLPNIQAVVPPPVDLSIDSLEITQAVQTPSNSVPLIAGRPAIVRVYAKYTGTAVPGNVTVSLTGV